MNTHHEILQASIDRLVSERLGTISGEFLSREFTGDKDHAMEVLLGMMEESARRFFSKMRDRIKDKKEEDARRERMLAAWQDLYDLGGEEKNQL